MYNTTVLEQEIATHLQSYEDASVKYLLDQSQDPARAPVGRRGREEGLVGREVRRLRTTRPSSVLLSGIVLVHGVEHVVHRGERQLSDGRVDARAH